ncbi:hypothetical protein AAHE18_08G066500 [Arachis hypogaea]
MVELALPLKHDEYSNPEARRDFILLMLQTLHQKLPSDSNNRYRMKVKKHITSDRASQILKITTDKKIVKLPFRQPRPISNFPFHIKWLRSPKYVKIIILALANLHLFQ